MINKEISNQMPRKLNEIKASLNSQIQDAISTAIAEKVLPSIQNTLEAQGSYTMVDRGSSGLQDSPRATNFTMADRRSTGLQRNSEVENSQKTGENRLSKCFMQENNRHVSRQRSVDSYSCEQNRDMVTGANPTPHITFTSSKPDDTSNCRSFPLCFSFFP